jgi:hypothetical protein
MKVRAADAVVHADPEVSMPPVGRFMIIFESKQLRSLSISALLPSLGADAGSMFDSF